MTGGTGRESAAEATPASAAALFGSRFELARRYAARLTGDAVVRGLIGPREASRVWSRHVLNCAVTAVLYPPGERVVDVGSGAGLPGLPVALARPDLGVDLVEPLERRAAFLRDVVGELGLAGQVRVVRGRAGDPAVRAEVGDAPWVTARAVAPLDRLVAWCLPLLRPGGRLAALKGASAQAEVDGYVPVPGLADLTVVRCGAGVVQPEVLVVMARRTAATQSGKGSYD